MVRKTKKGLRAPRLPIEGVLLLRKHQSIEDKRSKQLSRLHEKERRLYK